MKFLLSLAWKNLFRYKKRTIITCIAIAVGIAVYIWVDGFMTGIEKDSDKNLIDYETGSAQIIDTRYIEEKEYLSLKYTVKAPDSIISLIKGKGIPATKRITFGGEMFFEEGSKQVRIIGIDLETDNNVFVLDDKKLYAAGSKDLESGKYEIIIGEWLAQDLGVEIDDTIVIRTRTKYGVFTTLSLTVAGIIITENPVINKRCGFIPIELANEDLQMEGEVTEISVKFDEWKSVDEEVKKVNDLIVNDYPELKAYSYIDIFGGGALMESKKSFMGVMLFLVFVIAAVGISNTMLIAVFERIKEIGMMRAMGMQDSGIRITFMFESAGIGLIGSLFGLILGAALNSYTYFIGLDYTGLVGNMEWGYRMINVFKSAWNPSAFLLALIIGPVIAMLASFMPSSKALKMEVTECLRHQ